MPVIDPKVVTGFGIFQRANTLTVLCCLVLIEYSEHELAGFLANPFQTEQVVDWDALSLISIIVSQDC